MTLQPELLNAILSMDSYNRGYNRSIELETNINSTMLGNVRIVAHSSDLLDGDGNDNIDRPIGFYALAYDLNGDNVADAIAFRGTDYPKVLIVTEN